MKKVGIILIGILILVAVVAGVMALRPETSSTEQRDGSSTESSAADETPQATTEVTISDFNFQPKNIVVKKGDTVTWTNQDTAKHNVEFTSGSLEGDKGPLLAKSETHEVTFEEAGTFEYRCTPHPYMKATVTVEE